MESSPNIVLSKTMRSICSQERHYFRQFWRLNPRSSHPQPWSKEKAHSQGLFSTRLEVRERCRRRLLSKVWTGLISSGIPSSIQDNRKCSAHLQIYGLHYDLDLKNLLNCLLTCMKTLTRHAVTQIRSWIDPIPEAGQTWMNRCRGLRKWDGIGGDKMAEAEKQNRVGAKWSLLLRWTSQRLKKSLCRLLPFFWIQAPPPPFSENTLWIQGSSNISHKSSNFGI